MAKMRAWSAWNGHRSCPLSGSTASLVQLLCVQWKISSQWALRTASCAVAGSSFLTQIRQVPSGRHQLPAHVGQSGKGARRGGPAVPVGRVPQGREGSSLSPGPVAVGSAPWSAVAERGRLDQHAIRVGGGATRVG